MGRTFIGEHLTSSSKYETWNPRPPRQYKDLPNRQKVGQAQVNTSPQRTQASLVAIQYSLNRAVPNARSSSSETA